MKCIRRKRYIVVVAVLWLSALFLHKIIAFAPKDASRHAPPFRLTRNAIASAAAKIATPPHTEDRRPIRIDSEFAHAHEKLRSKQLESEKRNETSNVVTEKFNKIGVQSRETQTTTNKSDAIYRTADVNLVKRQSQIESVNKTQAKKPERRFPHILILGMGKAGTRAVYEMIKMHPDVKGPLPEVRYFDRHFNLGIQWYIHLMPPTHTWEKTIEKSPAYIISRVTPPRLLQAMKKFNRSHIKLIVVFRDPFTRALSEYIEWKLQRLRVGAAMPPFDKMALDKGGRININCPPVNTSAYSYHLENWLRYFSRDDFCFVSGENIVINPYPEMKRLERCLGLKNYLSSDNFVYDSSRGFYCMKKAGKKQCMNRSKGRPHPRIEKSVEDKLRAFYAPFNRKLYELTGRDFRWT